MRGLQIHFVLGWLLVVGTLALIGFYVPGKDRTIGESYLIFFFHFPSAMNCLNFFFFSGILSLIYLVSGKRSLDHWAATAAEVGVLACTITLVTGSIWAKAAWGHWWVITDPRLMTVAPASAIVRSAASASGASRIAAGSTAGPTTMKSLCMTSRRLTP